MRQSLAVALFTDESGARTALSATGVDPAQVGVYTPEVQAELVPTLTDAGVPDGEARYYADQVSAGQTLVVVASNDASRVRETLLERGGRDVQSQGAALVRPNGAGVRGGTGPKPIDLTGRWEDVASRYEMLYGQHYGTSDTTWQQMEPVYRWAWAQANREELRGRPWSEVATHLQREYDGNWPTAKGPIRDVWEDVAEEAAMGAEGGTDRIV